MLKNNLLTICRTNLADLIDKDGFSTDLNSIYGGGKHGIYFTRLEGDEFCSYVTIYPRRHHRAPDLQGYSSHFQVAPLRTYRPDWEQSRVTAFQFHIWESFRDDDTEFWKRTYFLLKNLLPMVPNFVQHLQSVMAAGINRDLMSIQEQIAFEEFLLVRYVRRLAEEGNPFYCSVVNRCVDASTKDILSFKVAKSFATELYPMLTESECGSFRCLKSEPLVVCHDIGVRLHFFGMGNGGSRRR